MSEVSTLEDDRPVDPDDELLVAYLDGELDNAARNEVEQRLLDDPSLRNRLHGLQAGWDFLDVLPDATSSEKLVESTLELVVADIIQKTPRSPLPVRTSSKPMLAIGLVITVLAGVAAYALARWQRTSALHAQLADLTLAENLDAYSNGSDLLLMRDLFANPNFERMVKASRQVGMLEVEASTAISDTPVADRPEAIKHLPLEERAQLEARWEVISRMDEQERAPIRQTAEAVAAQPDWETLLQTMTVYAAWAESLPKDVRKDIEQSDKEKRQAAINRAINATFDKVTRYAGRSLDDETSEQIYFELEALARQRLRENPALEDSIKQFVSRFSADPKSEDIVRFAIRQMVNDPMRGNRGPSQGIRTPPMTNDELLSVVKYLSDDALDTLDVLSNAGSFNIRNSLEVLSYWVNESVDRHSPFRTEERLLIDRYKQLTAQQRDAIDLLPPSEFKRTLDRLSNPGRPFRRPPTNR